MPRPRRTGRETKSCAGHRLRISTVLGELGIDLHARQDRHRDLDSITPGGSASVGRRQRSGTIADRERQAGMVAGFRGMQDPTPRTPTPALSVLDLVPVRTGQTSAQAVAASLALVARADALGYRRYWFAEHHNMPAVASTTPPVLIAAAAARSSRIRVGSGGVMLPNHSPLVVAEQFAALEALAPGRIDLGIGRAPGSDPVITQLLRMSGTTTDVERFPEHIRDILSLVSPDGATRAVHLRRRVRRARDSCRGRRARGVAARLERLLGAAGGIPRPALRVREPLLGRGARARARSVPRRVPADPRRTPSRGPSSRSTPSPPPPPRRPRPARCRSCA